MKNACLSIAIVTAVIGFPLSMINDNLGNLCIIVFLVTLTAGMVSRD